jgi:hypothetical protein
MLNGARLQGQLRDKIWPECVMTATYTSSVISTKLSLEKPLELPNGVRPILHTSLKMFSEVGVVTTKDKIQAKWTNQGATCIFVVYAEKHSKDGYQMLNLDTNAIIYSCDIIWLKLVTSIDS